MVGILINKKIINYQKSNYKKKLKEKKIETRDFFKSIADQPCFSKMIKKKQKTPISNNLWENGLYLPSSYNITDKRK